MTDTEQNSASAVADHRITRQYSGRREAAHAPAGDLAPEAEAALRQFSLERLMGYGVAFADAIELRARVGTGERWQDAADELAGAVLDSPEYAVAPATDASRAARLFRTSALIRMSQAMMLADDAERIAIYARAGALYATGANLAGDRTRVEIATGAGTLVGWLYPSATGKTHGRVLVIGGVEGWAMDCADAGIALARRGIETLTLDGPGHGESRMTYGSYLSPSFLDAYGEVVTWLAARGPEPIGVVGQSIGGSFAIHLAARDLRIAACVDNGGTTAPAMARYQRGAGAANKGLTFFRKMAAHVGHDVDDDAAEAVWRHVAPADAAFPIKCPLLIVQGALDPLISQHDADHLFASAASVDKQMVIFSDGDHCIYNHADDRNALIGDWLVSRLTTTA